MKLPHLLATVALVCALTGAAATAAAQDRVAVKAKRIVTGRGADLVDATMLVENGRVKAIGRELAIPAGYRTVDLGAAVVAPGFVDVASAAGAPNDLVESSVGIDDRGRTAEAVELAHRDFPLLAASGITTAVILPGDRSLVSGRGCAVKTGDRARLAEAEGPVRLTVTPSALSRARRPSSYADALEMLRVFLDESKGGRGQPAMIEFARGKRPGLCTVSSAAEIRDVLDLRRRYDLDLALIGAVDLQRALDGLAVKGLSVALAAPGPEADRRVSGLGALAEAAGITVAYFGDTPRRHPDVLRQGAITAVRHGLSSRAGLASITSAPAEIAGIGDRVGALAVGMDADFVVLSGDVLDARSRVLETWIDGRRAWAAKKERKAR
ncbi:MAG: amidohydrolase family protein [Planctomycetota bacterium]